MTSVFDKVVNQLKQDGGSVAELDYSKDVSIDPDRLDLEWLHQADLTLKYGEEVAEAQSRVDWEKESADVEEANASVRVRDFYLSEGLKLPTVDQLRAEILLDGQFKGRREELLRAKHSLGLVKAAYEAILMRKPALENLVRLLIQGYIAGPKEPYDLSDGIGMKQASIESGKEKARQVAREAGMVARRALKKEGGEVR
jgi:hypothetical protein